MFSLKKIFTQHSYSVGSSVLNLNAEKYYNEMFLKLKKKIEHSKSEFLLAGSYCACAYKHMRQKCCMQKLQRPQMRRKQLFAFLYNSRGGNYLNTW